MAEVGVRQVERPGLGLWLGLGLAHSLDFCVDPLFPNQELFGLFSSQICRASSPEAD